MPCVLKTAPTLEPVTIEEVKAFLRISGTEDDALVGALITAARVRLEFETRRSFLTTVWTLYLDEWPDADEGSAIKFPNPPLISIGSTAVTYYNASNALTTLAAANYVTSTAIEPGTITLAYGCSWPELYDRPLPIVIEFSAGYGATVASVPELLKTAIKQLVGLWYENREAAGEKALSPIPMCVDSIVSQYRVFEF